MKKIIIGLLIGFVGGLFASGGGLIAIPYFEYLLNMDEKQSRATTVFVILPVCITSIFIYNRNQGIDYKMGIMCGLGGAIGALIGSKILNKIKNKYLELIFIVFLIYSGVRLLIC